MTSRAELDVDAHATLARLRTSSPVAWVESLDCWLVTGYDDAVHVMRDSHTFTVDDPRFSTARVVGRSMLSVDGNEHTHHRSPFVAPFRPAQVERRFASDVTTLASGLVDRFAGRGHAELRRELAGPLSVAVVAEVLGLDASDADTVLGWYSAIVTAVTEMQADGHVGDEARDAMSSLTGRVHDSLGRGGSLLSEASTTLSEEQVVSNAAVMMFGGIETTEGMILNAVSHLLRSDVPAASVRDPAFLAAVVEESLRMEPAAAVVDRYATEDTSSSPAHAIRRGDLVRVSLTGANRDPAVFPDPDLFDPGRSNLRAQLSFAKGPHVCVAMDLARLEARVAVRELVTRLPGLRLAGPSDARGLVFRKPPSLEVAWDV